MLAPVSRWFGWLGECAAVGSCEATREFVTVVDESGFVTTYSWGNDYKDENPSNWYKNRPEDMLAACEATGTWLGWSFFGAKTRVSDDHMLDRFVEEAYGPAEGGRCRFALSARVGAPDHVQRRGTPVGHTGEGVAGRGQR